MAVDYTPVTWLSGYSSDATNLKITWASLSSYGVSSSTTDIREITRAISKAIEAHWNTLSGSDVPTKMLVTTNTRYNDSSDEFEEAHQIRYDLTVDSTSLASE